MKTKFPGGRKLKQARVARGWKVDKAAVELGISRPALENLERGRNWPSAQTLVKIARVYGMALEELAPEAAAKG